MIEPRQALHRMRKANPVPVLEDVPEAALSEILPLIHERRASTAGPGRGRPTAVRWLRPALAFGGAFIIVVGIGLALLLLRGGSDPDVAGTDEPVPTTVAAPVTTAPPVVTEATIPPTSVPATSVPAPVTTAAVGAESPITWARPTWTLVPGLSEAGVQHMEAVVAGGPGLVAVGWDCGEACVGPEDEGDAWDAAVWVSPDGVEWSRVPHDEEAFGGAGSQQMIDVIAAGPGLVAVGVVDHGYGPGRRSPHEIRPSEWYGDWPADRRDDIDAAVWTSVDGFAWSRVPDPSGILSSPGFGDAEGDEAMEALAVGEGLIVAVGSAHEDAAVWVSTDGLTWERIAHDEEVFGGRSGQWMHDVVYTGERFVAVGTDLNCEDAGGGYVGECTTGERSMQAAVWTSEDGVSWSRVPDDPSVFGGENEEFLSMWAVAASGDVIVAAGASPLYMALWMSEDGGLSWRREWDSDAPFAFESPREFSIDMANTVRFAGTLRHAPVKALLGTPDGVVPVGWDRSAAWIRRSDEIGSEPFEHVYVRYHLATRIAMADVVLVDGDRLIAVGYSEGDAAVWTAELGNR